MGRHLGSDIDALQVFYLVSHYGCTKDAGKQLGLSERSLHTIANRSHNWRLKMAIDFGMHVYRVNRARVLMGHGDDVVGPARTRPARGWRTG